MKQMQRRDLLKSAGMFSALAFSGLAATNKVSGAGCPPTQFHQTSTGTFFDTCTNEAIDYSIDSHTAIQICPNPDGSSTIRQHVELHGTAIGETSGNQYVLNEQFMDRVSISSNVCPLTDTQVLHLIVVSKGSAPNLKIKATFTFSTDANCNPTTSSSFSSDCVG